MPTVTGTILEPNGDATPRAPVRFQLIETVSVGDGVIPREYYDTVTDASGQFSLTLVQGDYEMTCKGEPIYITVGAEGGDITELITEGASFPSTVSATFGFFRVATLAELKTITTRAVNKLCVVLGSNTEGDGGGGTFWWDATAETADDTYINIRPNDFTSEGIWRRATDGIYNICWFGADTTGTSNVHAALTAAAAAGNNIVMPPGTYRLTANLTLAATKHLSFAKGAMFLISSGVTLTINGTIQAPHTQIFSGSGTVAFNGCSKPIPHWWGVTGDGATDDTAAFTKCLTAVPTGCEVEVTQGTYILDGLSMPKNVSLRLSAAAVLKHKAGATDHMVKMAVACSGFIEGGILDGNCDNQDIDENWFALLYPWGDGLQIRGVTFRNFMEAAIVDYQTATTLTISGCQFRNGFEVSEAATTKNTAIFFAPATQDARAHLTVENCRFENDAAPTSGYKACGGIFASGSSLVNAFHSVTIRNNYFRYVGDDAIVGPNHYGIATIDLYEEIRNATVVDNKIIDTYYIGLKMQNTQNLYCAGNYVKTNYTLAIDYTPGEREQSDEYECGKIINNVVEQSGEVGIYIRAGYKGGWRDTMVVGNTVKGSPYCIRVEGRTDYFAENEGYGPLLIQGNQLYSASANAIDFQFTQCDIKILDNYINATTGNGIAATSPGNETSSFTIRGNKIITNTLNFRPIRIFGVKHLIITENILTPSTSGGIAIELDEDSAGSHIETLIEDKNIITQGTKDINYSAVNVVQSDFRIIDTQDTVAQSTSTTETDLALISIPACTLCSRGDQLKFEGGGFFQASGTSKVLRIYLGATEIYDSFGVTASSVCDFSIEGTITRVTSTAANCVVDVRTNDGTGEKVSYHTSLEDLDTDLILKVTGQSSGGVTGDVTLGFLKVTKIGV